MPKKVISIEVACEISLTVQEAKEMLIDKLKADSISSKKSIDREFEILELYVTLLCAPEAALVSTFFAKSRTKKSRRFYQNS